MKDLIEALQILSKYTDKEYCYGAEHDEFYIWVDPDLVSKEDKERLVELDVGQHYDDGFVIYC
jgi:hypothetical protein